MRKLVLLVIFFSSMCANANHQQTFTITHVGVSDNSGTIFFNTSEVATGSECTNKKQFKVLLENRVADKIYSTVLMALASNKQVTVYYESNNCVGSSAKANVVLVGN